jgi:hypothetical protein
MANKNQNEEIIRYAKYAGIGLLAYTVLRPILASAKAVTEVAVGAAESKVVQQKTGLSPEQIRVCNDIANKLNYAMYDRSSIWTVFGGSFEDEEAVIQNLNRVSTMEEAGYISEKYTQTTSGKNLKRDVDTYLDISDIQRINSTVYTGLK